jgi:hypothetical protein
MRYVLLIYETPRDFEARNPEDSAHESYVAAWTAYHKTLLASGAYLGGEPLQETATATTVRLRDGGRRVQDGPFAETKEELGGFILLELPSLDAALDWAARCPAAVRGAVEVRPIQEGFREKVCEP